MTDGGQPPRSIRIRVGAREYDKPYHPDCPACFSPVLTQVDMLLAYGWPYERVLGYLRNLRLPGLAAVTAEVLAAHVDHLAPPHAESRRQLEAAAAARGAPMTDGPVPVVLADAAQLALQQAYAAMQDGDSSLIRDAVSLLRLQRDVERDERGIAVAGTVEQWQVAMREMLWIARKHLGANWAAFVRDLQSSEVLRAVMPPGREEAEGDDSAGAAGDRALRS
jgi:hypothetical protein